MVGAEALGEGGVELSRIPAAALVVAATFGVHGVEGHVRGHLGDQVDGASDPIPFLVRRGRFVQFDGPEQVGGEGVQLDLAHARLGRGDAHPVHGDAGVPGFQAADLDVLALAFVAFQGDAGQPADGVGHVGVGQAGDDVRGDHVDDVLGVLLLVQGLDLAAQPGGGHRDLLRIVHGGPQGDREPGRLAGLDLDLLGEGLGAQVKDFNLVGAGRELLGGERAVPIGHDREVAGRDVDCGADQRTLLRIQDLALDFRAALGAHPRGACKQEGHQGAGGAAAQEGMESVHGAPFGRLADVINN